MPIGKNAIKRVTGTKAEAQKEEKSIVAEVKAEPKKKEAPKKATPKKTAPQKTAPKKSMETEPSFSPVKIAQKVTKKPDAANARVGNGYINIGGDLPFYLL